MADQSEVNAIFQSVCESLRELQTTVNASNQQMTLIMMMMSHHATHQHGLVFHPQGLDHPLSYALVVVRDSVLEGTSTRPISPNLWLPITLVNINLTAHNTLQICQMAS